MNSYRDKESGRIVQAEQFNPEKRPWPEQMIPWTDVRPRDASWGYVKKDGKKLHVWATDWIVSDGTANILAYRDGDFQTEFEPCIVANAVAPGWEGQNTFIPNVTATAATFVPFAVSGNAPQSTLISEYRIREIVQEEIEKWWKQQMGWLRNQPRDDYEVK